MRSRSSPQALRCGPRLAGCGLWAVGCGLCPEPGDPPAAFPPVIHRPDRCGQLHHSLVSGSGGEAGTLCWDWCPVGCAGKVTPARTLRAVGGEGGWPGAAWPVGFPGLGGAQALEGAGSAEPTEPRERAARATCSPLGGLASFSAVTFSTMRWGEAAVTRVRQVTYPHKSSGGWVRLALSGAFPVPPKPRTAF